MKTSRKEQVQKEQKVQKEIQVALASLLIIGILFMSSLAVFIFTNI